MADTIEQFVRAGSFRESWRDRFQNKWPAMTTMMMRSETEIDYPNITPSPEFGIKNPSIRSWSSNPDTWAESRGGEITDEESSSRVTKGDKRCEKICRGVLCLFLILSVLAAAFAGIGLAILLTQPEFGLTGHSKSDQVSYVDADLEGPERRALTDQFCNLVLTMLNDSRFPIDRGIQSCDTILKFTKGLEGLHIEIDVKPSDGYTLKEKFLRALKDLADTRNTNDESALNKDSKPKERYRNIFENTGLIFPKTGGFIDFLPEVLDDKPDNKSEITTDTKATATEVTVDTKATPTEVFTDTKETHNEVTTNIKETQTEVSTDTKKTLTEVAVDTKRVQTEVGADAKETPTKDGAHTKITSTEVGAVTKEASAESIQPISTTKDSTIYSIDLNNTTSEILAINETTEGPETNKPNITVNKDTDNLKQSTNIKQEVSEAVSVFLDKAKLVESITEMISSVGKGKYTKKPELEKYDTTTKTSKHQNDSAIEKVTDAKRHSTVTTLSTKIDNKPKDTQIAYHESEKTITSEKSTFAPKVESTWTSAAPTPASVTEQIELLNVTPSNEEKTTEIVDYLYDEISTEASTTVLSVSTPKTSTDTPGDVQRVTDIQNVKSTTMGITPEDKINSTANLNNKDNTSAIKSVKLFEVNKMGNASGIALNVNKTDTKRPKDVVAESLMSGGFMRLPMKTTSNFKFLFSSGNGKDKQINSADVKTKTTVVVKKRSNEINNSKSKI